VFAILGKNGGRIRRALVGSSIAVALGASYLVLAGPAPAAHAFIPIGCELSVTTPYKSGTTLYSDTKVSCKSATSLNAAIAIDEKFVIWLNRASASVGTAKNVRTRSVSTSVSCKGHGTDKWRGRGSSNGAGLNSKEVKITC
jgi:hypothetical protein